VTSLRTQHLATIINTQARSVLEKLFYPQMMSFLLRQVDLQNRDVLYYLERLDAFGIMETHIMDRVMQEYWQSDLDAGGSFFDFSTASGILRADDNLQTETDSDYERANRFYVYRDITRTQPNRFSFMVVRKSMQTRYFLEILFFLTLTLYFQYKLIVFTQAWNTAIDEMTTIREKILEY